MRMKVFTLAGSKVVSHAINWMLHFTGEFFLKFSASRRAVFLALLMVTSQFCLAAAGPITGKITDDKGDPLVGVTIQVKGTQQTVTTDKDGKFTINAEATDVLVISYVGFATREVTIEGRSTVDIALQPNAQTMTDVVVVGYGKQKKVN